MYGIRYGRRKRYHCYYCLAVFKMGSVTLYAVHFFLGIFVCSRALWRVCDERRWLVANDLCVYNVPTISYGVRFILNRHNVVRRSANGSLEKYFK